MRPLPCDLCGATTFARFWRGRDRDKLLTYLICTGCSMASMNPRPSAEELASFYRSDYRRERGIGDPWRTDSVSRHLISERQRAIQVIHLLQPYLSRGLSVLEIGCGTGFLLASLRDQYDAVVEGIEPDEHYAAYARDQRNVNVVASTVENFIPQKQYDLIVMVEVLEHLSSARRALLTMRGFLRTGGLLYVQVPDPYTHRTVALAHTHVFIEETLANMLIACGFSPVRVNTHKDAASSMPPYLLSGLARAGGQASPVAAPSYRRVLLKRRLTRAPVASLEALYAVRGRILMILRALLGRRVYEMLRKLYWGRLPSSEAPNTSPRPRDR